MLQNYSKSGSKAIVIKKLTIFMKKNFVGIRKKF